MRKRHAAAAATAAAKAAAASEDEADAVSSDGEGAPAAAGKHETGDKGSGGPSGSKADNKLAIRRQKNRCVPLGLGVVCTGVIINP